MEVGVRAHLTRLKVGASLSLSVTWAKSNSLAIQEEDDEASPKTWPYFLKVVGWLGGWREEGGWGGGLNGASGLTSWPRLLERRNSNDLAGVVPFKRNKSRKFRYPPTCGLNFSIFTRELPVFQSGRMLQIHLLCFRSIFVLLWIFQTLPICSWRYGWEGWGKKEYGWRSDWQIVWLKLNRRRRNKEK